MAPQLESFLLVAGMATITLPLVYIAYKSIHAGTSAAQIGGTLLGITIEIAGGIAAWLGSVIILVALWINYVLPIFFQYEIWHVKGQIRYEDPKLGIWRNAHNDVDVSIQPPGWEVKGGVLDITVFLYANDPNKAEHNKFPTIDIYRGPRHNKEIINLNTSNNVKRMDGNIIDLGNIDLSVIENSPLPKNIQR